LDCARNSTTECLVRKRLLMLDVAVHRDESFDAIRCALQELTIP